MTTEPNKRKHKLTTDEVEQWIEDHPIGVQEKRECDACYVEASIITAAEVSNWCMVGPDCGGRPEYVMAMVADGAVTTTTACSFHYVLLMKYNSGELQGTHECGKGPPAGAA